MDKPTPHLFFFKQQLAEEKSEKESLSSPDPALAPTASSPKTINNKPNCNLLQCYKQFLKRKFSSSSDRGESPSPTSSPPSGSLYSGGLNAGAGGASARADTTIAAAGVIAAALCDDSKATFSKPTPSTGTRNANKRCSTAKDCTVTSKGWEASPKLASLFDSFIRSNLQEEEEAEATTSAPKPCQFLGLVNKIITNVFTGVEAEDSLPKDQTSPICQLLSTTEPSPAPPLATPPQISDTVYQQLIEFEFNYESILKKFTPANSSAEGSLSRSTLNDLESARITELVTVLAPLQLCLSTQSEVMSQAKKDLFRSISGDGDVTVDFQRQTLLKIIETSFNLCIGLALQLEAFARLNSADQMSLLKNSVMEIMLLRSIMIRPQECEAPSGNSSHVHDFEVDVETTTTSPHIQALLEPMEQSAGSDSIRGVLQSTDDRRAEEQRQRQLAAEYAKSFHDFYARLEGTFDAEWREDRTIFCLLFAILLFRPTASGITEPAKVRDEQVTYVYLLKRYLEDKLKSYCTARSHFIRIFDRLEELHQMDQSVIQKLLQLELASAQNLIEKLCIC